MKSVESFEHNKEIELQITKKLTEEKNYILIKLQAI